MKRTFLWNFEAVVPIMEFDFRVTVVALQAVRGAIIEKSEPSVSFGSESRILANFLDVPITPKFLAESADFTPFEYRYTSKITQLTGFQSKSKDFQVAGKTLRNFAEHRLGTSIEGALFLCLKNFNSDGRASIPTLASGSSTLDLLKATVTLQDSDGLKKAMELILDPMLETGHSIIKMNPAIEKEFPNLTVLAEPNAVGKTFGDLVAEAVCPVREAIIA